MIAATGLAALLLAQAVPAADASSGAPSSTSAAAAPMPTGAEMTARIEANDAALFWNFFEACDPAAAAPLLHEDFRMLHDLAGLAAASAEEFLAGEREQCDRRKPGGEDEGYRNRRLLVPGSRTIKQLGDWGALEEAHHTFHEWRGEEKGWVQTGGARYIHLWQWMPHEARFRLRESLSVDHAAAAPYPPRETGTGTDTGMDTGAG